jgi:hypothetical protein
MSSAPDRTDASISYNFVLITQLRRVHRELDALIRIAAQEPGEPYDSERLHRETERLARGFLYLTEKLLARVTTTSANERSPAHANQERNASAAAA